MKRRLLSHLGTEIVVVLELASGLAYESPVDPAPILRAPYFLFFESSCVSSYPVKVMCPLRIGCIEHSVDRLECNGPNVFSSSISGNCRGQVQRQTEMMYSVYQN